MLKYDEYQGKNCPEIVRELSDANPVMPTPNIGTCPEDVRETTLYNNIKNNNTSKDVFGGLSDESHDDQPIKIKSKKSQSVPYQAMIDAITKYFLKWQNTSCSWYPKEQAQTVLAKCNSEYMQQHNRPFTLDNWRGYLGYIAKIADG